MSMIGKSLVHYEISAQIGRGGMGEVYQAKDTKLGRDVAIKVLPEEFAMDADRVARFQREAKLLASLNHPNIAAIYGLEEFEGAHFLVLELIEGKSLSDRIKTGPIPVEEALKLALQMAEALEAAHEKGVIHRDLKPANIKVTPDGKVKVLDFGLAKAYAGDQENISPLDSPTISAAATQKGVILGTAAYMSPEQAKGKSVDKRADIWAFGVVLYEMLTGKAAFSGTDVTDTLAAVIRSEPEWKSLPANLHWRLREVLERCLEKEAKNRYSGISDARVDIQKVLADPSGVLVQPIPTAKPRRKVRLGLPWVAAITIVGIIIAGVVGWFIKPTAPKRVMRLEYELPEGQQFNLMLGRLAEFQLALSPDGSQFVYSTTDGLYLRSMNELNARHIAGTDKDSFSPSFSPDGQWICYLSQSDEKLKKIGVSGGAPVVLCDISTTLASASWDSDDMIVYSDPLSGIMQGSANGGTPETLVKGSLAEFSKDGFAVYPQMLPGRDTLLFTKIFDLNITNNEIVVYSLQSGKEKVLFKGGLGARYLPTGHIVYRLDNNDSRNLFSVPFDLDKLEVTGGAVSVLEGIRGHAFSDSGTLVYVPQPAVSPGAAGATPAGLSLVWVSREGKEEPLEATPDHYGDGKISPDGTKVALSITTTDNQDIWIWDIPQKTLTKLTFDKDMDNTPIWTPDGKRIAFFSTRGGTIGDVYWKSADGIGEAEPLVSKPDRSIDPCSFSRDGRFLAIQELFLSPFGFDIGMISMEGNRESKLLLQENYSECQPQISPDGRYLAYQSDESGEENIYVRPFPNVNEGKWQVSRNGGNSPLWSPDGRELFYRSVDETMAVEIETDPTFRHGNHKSLFQGTYFSNNFMKVTITPWDIHPNGEKFLMIKRPDSTGEASTAPGPQPKIIVVTNWFEELKQRVPMD